MKIRHYRVVAIVFMLVLLMQLPSMATAEQVDSDNISRLCIAPTGRMLPSGTVNMAIGGAFASQGGKEYLGLFSVGLGGVAEFEISTAHIVTNVLDASEAISTTALKFTVFKPKEGSKIPHAMVALRSNRWSEVEGSGSALAGPADANEDITGVDFDTHLTSLYLSLTSVLSQSYTVHAGAVWHDVRTKNLKYSGREDRPSDTKNALIGFYGGVEHRLNENTISMFEFGEKPKIEFSDDMREITVKQIWHGVAGVRFFLTPYAAIDAGIRYRNDYSGLADAEIVMGLNLGLNILDEIRKKRQQKLDE